MKKTLESYLDERGWIGHFEKEPDGSIKYDQITGLPVLEFGDGVQRLSMYTLCKWFLSGDIERVYLGGNFLHEMSLIWLPNGEPVRHWSRKAWYGKSGTMSGDQLEPLMWCYVVMNRQKEFWSLWWKLCKRGFFAWNTKKIGQTTEEWKPGDFLLLRMIGPTLRMLFKLPLGLGFLFWPLILAWDIVWTGLNTFVRIIVPLFDRDDTGDDLNFFCTLIGGKLVGPTPASWFLRNLYLGLRPLSGTQSYRRRNRHFLGVMTAAENYFMEEAAPPLHHIIWAVALKL